MRNPNRRATYAHTSFPNTPETDMEEYVLHDVGVKTDDVEETVRLMATDPGSALDLVNAMGDIEFGALLRVAPKLKVEHAAS